MVHMFGNVNGFSYQPPNINVFDLAKEQDNKPVRFCDTQAGKDMPEVKVDISPEGLKALHGSKFPGSIDIKAEQEKIKFYSEHQPIESFQNRLFRTMQEGIEQLKQENPGRSISLDEKESILMKGFQSIVDEISAGYEDGTRVRFVEDKASEDGYRRLSKDEELAILQQEFDEFANARFGEKHQKESEEVAKAINGLQKIKQQMGRQDIRYYEPEKIPNGFLEKLLKSARNYIASKDVF